MGLFDGQSPDIYGRLMEAFGGQSRLDTSLPTEQMQLGIGNAMATPQAGGGVGSLIGSLFGGSGQKEKGELQDLSVKLGIPQPKEQWKTLLPVMLTQIGAALMQPPGPQRAAVFAQLPATMMAAQKMNREDAHNRALMGVYREKIKAESKADPFALEEAKQKGRESLQNMREDLQTKIQGMRDNSLDRRLSAQEQRQLSMFENQAKMLDARLAQQFQMQQNQFGQQVKLQQTKPQATYSPANLVNEQGETVPGRLNKFTGKVEPIPPVQQVGKKAKSNEADELIKSFLNPGSAGVKAAAAPGKPIGKTPDGRTVYQDASGKKFTME